MWTRRSFLRVSSFGLEALQAAAAAVAGQTPESVAGDEAYWRTVQQAFDVDRTLISG